MARLAGLRVVEPSLETVGRVRDVVCVVPRTGRRPPRVLGTVVEVQRRRIFVPMTRVASISPSAVLLSTSAVSLRPFTRRPGETLVLEELLDRRVTLDESGDSGTVLDLGLEQTREDWLITRVAVAVGGGRLRRRRTRVVQAGWDEVSGIELGDVDQGAALLAAFEGLRPADLASVVSDLSASRRAQVVRALDDESLADVLEELPEDEQVEILEGLDEDRAADVVDAMDPDDATDLLRELPGPQRERLLDAIDDDEAAELRRLLAYRDDTAGGLMTPEPVVLAPDATVADALAALREPQVPPALAAQAFVVRPPYETPTGRYVGTGHIQRLLREPPSTLVAGVVDTDLAPLPSDAGLHAVARHLATYDIVAAPVCDPAGRLLGAVTVDDVLDHLLPKDWRDEPAPAAPVTDSPRRPRAGGAPHGDGRATRVRAAAGGRSGAGTRPGGVGGRRG